MQKESPGLISSDTRAAVDELLATAGFAGPYSIQPLRGGNNRVYRVEVCGKVVFLKAYFQHPEDSRDRLAAEFAFSTFAWSRGLRALPQPFAYDPHHYLGVYEFVSGRTLVPHEVTAGVVSQALDFFCDINRHKHLTEAQLLPRASEACFSLAEHLSCVERRIQRLLTLDHRSPIGCDAAQFVRSDLFSAWKEALIRVRQQTSLCAWNVAAEVQTSERCLSPSDFGFHNALLSNQGWLRFLDFEYAGWDDPAKMVCDFFCQPAVPVPMHLFDLVVQRVAQSFSDAALPARIGLLLPVYQVKWCCILLNDFLPLGRRRRSFAGGTAAQEEQKARQLQKARQALKNLVSPALARYT